MGSQFSQLGAGGEVGGGYSSSANSSSKGQTYAQGSSSAGNRGFINNFAAKGSSLNADQGINPPEGGSFSWRKVAFYLGAAAVGWFVWKRF